MINASYNSKDPRIEYKELIEDIEIKLDEADYAAASSDIRYTHEEVFSKFRFEDSVFKGQPQPHG